VRKSVRSRASNCVGLITHFEAHTYDRADATMPRYAAVAAECFDDERVGAKIVLCDTEQEAFEFLGDSVVEGNAPDGVYDLDTAEKIDVHVLTPDRYALSRAGRYGQSPGGVVRTAGQARRQRHVGRSMSNETSNELSRTARIARGSLPGRARTIACIYGARADPNQPDGRASAGS
jgi:hypothetical protein